jgi:hypothetical protein
VDAAAEEMSGRKMSSSELRLSLAALVRSSAASRLRLLESLAVSSPCLSWLQSGAPRADEIQRFGREATSENTSTDSRHAYATPSRE